MKHAIAGPEGHGSKPQLISKPTNGLLARELTKFGAVSSGAINQAAEAMEATLGAAVLAAFPPSERFQMRVRVACNVALVLLRVRSYLARHGRVASENQTGQSPFPHVSGILRCGLVQQIPALVHVEVLTSEAEMCLLAITAAAKEGPFHQQAAQVAALRTATYIRSVCSG